MKNVLWLPFALCLFTAPALANDADKAALATARGFVLNALPGECDDTSIYGDDGAFADAAYQLSWTPDWGGENDPKQHVMLYQIFCFAGAYNLVHAYAFKAEGENFSLISFAVPTYKIEYADGDENQTQLKAPPRVTGFSTTATLVNSGFDADTYTLTSSSKWRGLGDAWSSGTWEFRSGQFVLKAYAVDPTYEANLDNPTDEQIARYYELYP